MLFIEMETYISFSPFSAFAFVDSSRKFWAYFPVFGIFFDILPRTFGVAVMTQNFKVTLFIRVLLVLCEEAGLYLRLFAFTPGCSLKMASRSAEAIHRFHLIAGRLSVKCDHHFVNFLAFQSQNERH